MGRTIEQLTAANELSTAAQGYRVIADAEGWPITPGKYGRLENLGTATPGQPGQLVAFTDSTRIFSRALALAGVSHHQTGDDEYRVPAGPLPHRGRRGRLDGVVIWFDCECRARIARRADDGDVLDLNG